MINSLARCVEHFYVHHSIQLLIRVNTDMNVDGLSVIVPHRVQ